MGTQFRVTVYATDIRSAQQAIARAFARAAELDAKLSDYRDDSELNQLCRTRRMRVSDDLRRVLAYSQRVARESDGAFDITLGPFIRLWRESRRTRILPSPQQIAEARTRIGYRKIILRRVEVFLAAPAMQLDLGGIAKGFAAAEMLLVLRDAGFPQSLVAAGGDLAIGDPPPGRAAGWRVELGATGEVRDLSRCSVSTSGDESQFVEINGVRYSHIIDPRTGLGLIKSRPTTVIAAEGMEADALATALQVRPGAAKKLARKHPSARMFPNEALP